MTRKNRNSHVVFLVAVAGFGGSFVPNAYAQSAFPQNGGSGRVERIHSPCEVYGSGFVAVEGTQTCVRIGGHVHVELGVGRPIGFERASPLATPHADLRGAALVQGGDTIPAGLRLDGAPTD
jgi:hypothetical protein